MSEDWVRVLAKRLPQILTAAAILATVFLLYSANQKNVETRMAQEKLDLLNTKLEHYRKLENSYGHASERYYADKPVLILKTEGAEEKFKIYWDSEGKKDSFASWTCPENGKGITVKWGDAFEDHLADLFVTPGKQAGGYVITLTDNISDDTFQVLVIVK